MRCGATHPAVKGIVAATRGNHGQSIGFAAGGTAFRRRSSRPHGNSTARTRR
jgi:threonine dehydratase